MGTEIIADAQPARPKWLDLLQGIGPGLVVALGSLGPRDIVSNSVAGSTAGYGLLWVLLVSLVIRLTMLDASARYVMVSGETLLGGCGRFGRPVVLTWTVVTVLRRHVNELLTLTLLGAAGHMILPLPVRHSPLIWGLASWIAAFVLVWWGRYNAVEKLSKPLTILTGACVAVTAILSKPDLGRLVSGVLHPVLPTDRAAYGPWLVVMGVLAATMGTFSSVRYAAFVHEKGWRSIENARRQRVDLLTSVLGMFLILALMQIAAAGALQPRGIQVKRLEDLAPIFGTIFGRGGVILFGLTLWCVTFSGCVATASAYGIIVSDVFHRFVKPSRALIEDGQGAGTLPAYRWMILYLFVLPTYVLVTNWSAVTLVFVVGAVNLISVPFIALLILRLTGDRKIMGRHVNGWFTNTVLVAAVFCSVFLAWRGMLDLLKGAR